MNVGLDCHKSRVLRLALIQPERLLLYAMDRRHPWRHPVGVDGGDPASFRPIPYLIQHV